MSFYWNAQLRDWERTVHSQRQHIRELEAALATAREAMWDAREGWRYIRTYHGDLYGVGWDRVQTKLDAALARFGGET